MGRFICDANVVNPCYSNILSVWGLSSIHQQTFRLHRYCGLSGTMSSDASVTDEIAFKTMLTFLSDPCRPGVQSQGPDVCPAYIVMTDSGW